MRRAFGYFRLQLKRFFKLMPVVLLLSAFLLATVGLVFVGLFAESESDEQNSLVKIGIVGDVSDSYLSMAVNALQNDESTRFSLEIIPLESEGTAADMLRRGDLVAYILMPDDFVAKAMSGDLEQITCVTAAGASDFGTRVANELMQTVTEMVTYSQKAIFGFQSSAQDNGMSYDEASDLGDLVALRVIKVIVDRDAAYEIDEIGDSGVKELKDPLVCGMLVLVIMLWGITCCTIFAARNSALYRVLSSKGTGSAAQVLAEYAAYLVFMAATFAVLTAAVVLVLQFTPPMPLLEKYDFTRLVPGMLIPVLTISAMHFFLYEVASGVVSGALLQFFCAMGMGYISGCVYPAYYFPRIVQNTAALFPAWSSRIWFDELVAGKPSLSTLAILTAYFAAFLILSVLVRRARIRRRGGAA